MGARDLSSAESQASPVLARKRGAFSRLARRGALALGIAACVASGTGFLTFVNQLDQVETGHLREADGAVALTGGTDRIADAVNLVSKGYAGRLLITKKLRRRQVGPHLLGEKVNG